MPTFHRPPDRRVTPPSVPPARALTPTARRLHRLLADLDERQLDAVTNEWFAARLGVSARSVTTALSRLSAAGLITIESRRGHPRSDRAGRTIRLTGREGGERR